MKCKNPNLAYMDCWMEENQIDCDGCNYKNDKGVPQLVEKLAEAKKKSPNAICFIKSDCSDLDFSLLPNGPCVFSAKRFPTAICRRRLDQEGTQSKELSSELLSKSKDGAFQA